MYIYTLTYRGTTNLIVSIHVFILDNILQSNYVKISHPNKAREAHVVLYFEFIEILKQGITIAYIQRSTLSSKGFLMSLYG